MNTFEVKMQHTAKTLEALAHMQYDLFCRKNLIVRNLLSVAIVIAGLVNHESWWGILLIAYGCYLSTSKYSAANHTAHKLTEQLEQTSMPFPSSRYVFGEKQMEVYTLPEDTLLGEPMAYRDICRLGEDAGYFYVFRDEFGGYMVPKDQLREREGEFRRFIQDKTGQNFRTRQAPIIRLMRRIFQGRQTA